MPDCVKALVSGEPILLRNPAAVRPWQNVLEPLAGYLWLAVRMRQEPGIYAGAWNFGPDLQAASVTVRELASLMIEQWGGGSWEDVSIENQDAPGEDMCLRLDCTKARTQLRWRTVLSVREALERAVQWYRAYYFDAGFDGSALALQQIESYVNCARANDLPWASDGDPIRPANRAQADGDIAQIQRRF